ncbi:serine/threonine-protein kinase [Bathymodiolus thermophilus thioautotrophic gill symbiont]|uniref:serine/threonine-protein kinase n=1 Tax=Bathymodiolus thermophilus thioautotrophic gill symbiont TaxID=2360 RepID=UPI001115C1A1|nr:serine/threonine-protein kinase [Bathymodiolus thermophilus thioautotrophic gill symbiont]
MALNITLNPGDSLYKYQLIRKIGGGNFGEVWLADDVTISKEVAVKILDESMVPVAENLKEAQIGHLLEHQNVVHVHYADVVGILGVNVVIIAMDFHPHGSTVGMLNPSNFLSIIQSIKIMIDILRGLEYLHEKGLYHNDIKPSNILVGPRGEGILTDYGISCLAPNLQPAQAPNAYILHRAPETGVHNNISVQTDIYQVGLTLFRLVNGIGLIQELLLAHGQDKFEQLKAQEKIPKASNYQLFVPPSLKRIISKAIKADPNSRYQSSLEMRRALEQIAIYGYWSTDSTGSYLGYYDKQVFRFETIKTRTGLKFQAYKKRLKTGKEVKIGKMSSSCANEQEVKKLKKKLMLAVVSGSL